MGQFGFRKERSTNKTTYKIMHEMVHTKVMYPEFSDLSKAFDC